MKATLSHAMITILLLLAFSNFGFAQAPSTQERIPVKLVIVISRYEGDRKLSSLPFTLLATANGERASLNNGVNMPISSAGTTDGKPTTSITYTNIGTSIVGTVTTESGRYRVNLSIDDKSVVDVKTAPTTGATAKASDQPSFRAVSFNSTVSLKEGEQKQIFSAADRISGEVTKIDVTLTLDK